jgi:GNAT superfamily N-acetyltransferase
MSTPPVPFTPVPLTPDLFDKAATVCARAFFDDPMCVLWAPNEEVRLRKVAAFYRAVFRCAQGYSQTYSVPGTASGIAMWSPPGGPDWPLLNKLRSGMMFVPLMFGWRGYRHYRALIGLCERVHEQTMKEPHWYLDTLCTDPPMQGQGIATTLLQMVCQKADDAGQPCYLETLTERNVGFYAKRGFHVVWEGAYSGGPKLWTMRRDPQK